MSNSGSQDLSEKLDQLILINAMMLTAGIEKKSEKILLLDKAGLDRKTIAKICDTTPNSVSAVLSAEGKVKAKK